MEVVERAELFEEGWNWIIARLSPDYRRWYSTRTTGTAPLGELGE